MTLRCAPDNPAALAEALLSVLQNVPERALEQEAHRGHEAIQLLRTRCSRYLGLKSRALTGASSAAHRCSAASWCLLLAALTLPGIAA